MIEIELVFSVDNTNRNPNSFNAVNAMLSLSRQTMDMYMGHRVNFLVETAHSTNALLLRSSIGMSASALDQVEIL